MDKNMQDLMNAAKIKLEMQEKQSDVNEDTNDNTDDIYASLREEMIEEYESDESSDSYNIKRTGSQDDFFNDIQYASDEYDEYAIDPNDTPVFPDGPGISQVNLWKKQFAKEKIYHTQIIEKHFIFRTLNRFEYKQIVAYENLDALRREELICQTCTLWPMNYNFKTMASEDNGYPSTLAQIIMENSGFTKEYGIEVL